MASFTSRWCPRLVPLVALLAAAAPAIAWTAAPAPVQMPQQLVQGRRPARVAVIAARDVHERSLAAIEAIRDQIAGLRAHMLVEWVDKLQVTLPEQVRVAREIARRTRASMVLWADLSLPDQIFVYIGKGDTGRILVRSVRSAGGTEGRLEAMSLIVRSSVSALAGGAEIGFLPPPAPPKVVVAAPRPTSAPTRRLAAALGYGVFGFGDRLSHGAQLGLGIKALPWLRLALSFRALVAMRADVASAAVTFRRYPLGVEAGAEWDWRSLGAEAGAGIWIERLTWRVTALRPDIAAVGKSGRWVVAGQLFGGVSWRPALAVTLTLRLGIDLPHDTRAFRVEGSSTEEVVDPWPVQPWVLAGVRLALF